MQPSTAARRSAHGVSAGLVLGVGMGGFIDGIALHQIAHRHQMGSAVLPPHTMDAMRQNMRWDGLFHLGTWLITMGGVWLLWRDAHRGAVPPGRVFIGRMLPGWAAFNLVQGVIDHHLLQLHHVRDLPVHVPLYDRVFLLVGGVRLGAIGWMMTRSGAASPAEVPPTTIPLPASPCPIRRSALFPWRLPSPVARRRWDARRLHPPLGRWCRRRGSPTGSTSVGAYRVAARCRRKTGWPFCTTW